MMMSVMSTFDPCLSFKLPVNWVSLMLTFSVLNASVWSSLSGLKTFLFYLLKSILSFGSRPSLYGLFVFILLINLSGMIPSSYPISSSAVWGFSLSIPFWLSGVLYDLNFKYLTVLSHLVPETSGLGMALLLVWIEFSSMIMRPLSLGVRLLANITAGHIMMGLIESSISIDAVSVSIFQFIVLLVIMGLEFAVAVIQAYVFTQLLFLYSVENK
nr:ATP synthase F0 subunit 6 [Linognathus africanus]